MLSGTVKLNYEYALLQAQLAQAYAAMGRLADASRKVSRATQRTAGRPDFLKLLDSVPFNDPSDYLLEKDLIVPLLDMRMQLLAAQGLALEAMQSYYEMAGLGRLPEGHRAIALAGRLTAQIRGPGELRGRVQMDGSSWKQYLSRRRFTLDGIQGEVRGLTLRCSNGSKVLEYRPGGEWMVPEGWAPCAVSVDAEPGARFEFVELPEEPAAPSPGH
jgi:hypothetical protein